MRKSITATKTTWIIDKGMEYWYEESTTSYGKVYHIFVSPTSEDSWLASFYDEEDFAETFSMN